MALVSGRIRKAPYIKTGCGPQGDSTMYAIELSEMIKSYNSDEKFYTNYSALFFAKTQGANDLYSKVLQKVRLLSLLAKNWKLISNKGRTGEHLLSCKWITLDLNHSCQRQKWPANHNSNKDGNSHKQPAPQPQNRAQPQYNEPPAGFDDSEIRSR